MKFSFHGCDKVELSCVHHFSRKDSQYYDNDTQTNECAKSSSDVSLIMVDHREDMHSTMGSSSSLRTQCTASGECFLSFSKLLL